MVDLAGSETLTYQFGDAQQKETKAINLSLTQLKTVITALSKKDKFVPYRNSSLTKLLRKSLGISLFLSFLVLSLSLSLSLYAPG